MAGVRVRARGAEHGKEDRLFRSFLEFFFSRGKTRNDDDGGFFFSPLPTTSNVFPTTKKSFQDNCSILGETIDYGPYGWIEAFDVDFTPNTSDLPGRRYSFRNQPAAVAWNVERLAAAFVMTKLVEDVERAGEAVEAYSRAVSSTYEGIVAAKFGERERERVFELLF